MIPAFQLGPFDAWRPIGKGGMGEVWQGQHRATGTDVAIKLVTASSLKSATFERAFEAEVRAVACLDHPGIIRLYDAGSVSDAQAAGSGGAVEAGTPYLVMELAEGRNLRTAPPPRQWEPVKAVLRDILDALAHAHARGVIHRDVKPANILWGPSLLPDAPARVIVSDFGIAHAGEGGGGGPTWGTPAYMAPERFTLEWRDLGPWTDLYAVGCLAFALLRGQPPFPGDPLSRAMQAHLYRPVPLLRARCAVPEGLDAWLRGLLAKAPGDRFQAAADAAWALDQLGRAGPLPRGSAPSTSDSHDTAVGSGTGVPFRQGRAPPSPATPPPHHRSGAALPPSVDAGAAEITWTDDTFEPSARSQVTARVRRARVARRARHPIPPMPPSWQRDTPRRRLRALPGSGLRLFGLRVVRLVDREEERDQLWQALVTVHSAEHPVGVLLRGQVGTGKSRLAMWLGERAVETGAAIVLRADHGAGETVPALARTVAEHLRCRGLGRRALRGRVEAWLRNRDITDEWLSRDLTSVAALGAGIDPALVPPPQDLRGTLRRFLTLLAVERPVVLHLDDIPFSTTSLALVSSLLQQAPRLPILLLMTAREQALAERPATAEALTDLASRGLLQEIEVGELPAAWRVRFVRELAGFDVDLAERIAARTGGNPLFTVALVRDWIARGVLEEHSLGLRLPEGETLRLPDDLHEVWHNHIAGVLDDAGADARPALELAAALGETVERTEWRDVCNEAGVVLPPGLFSRLDAERLVVGTEQSWRWAHGMVRESVLRECEEAGRLAGAHASCARMLLARDGPATHDAREAPANAPGPLDQRRAPPSAASSPPPPVVQERIGRHLAAAGEPAAALPFLESGARGRLAAGDPTAALTLLAELDACLRTQPNHAVGTAHARAILLRARALAAQGRIDDAGRQARRAALAARTLTRDKDKVELRTLRAHALLVQAEVAVDSGLPTDAQRLLYEARRLLGLDASVPDLGACQRLAGTLHRALGDLDAAEESWAEAAEYFGALGLEAERASCLLGLAEVAVDRHDPDLALELLTTAIGRYRALHHRQGEADCLRVSAEAARLQGELDAAEHRYRRAQRIYGRAGSARTADCRLGRARLALQRGDAAEAERLLRAAGGAQATRVALRARAAALALDIAATRADWAAFDLAFADLGRLLIQSGLGLIEVEDLVADAARSAAAAGQRGRAARVRAVLRH